MADKLNPTPEQLAVIDAARGRESINIDAYAGCAKTTTLTLAAQVIKAPGLALAFNRSIAAELKDRFPSNFQVKTMNGLGMLAWARRPGASEKLEIDDRKLGKLVTQVIKDRKLEFNSEQWDSLRQLVSAAMNAGVVPAGSGPEGLAPDAPVVWLDLAEGLFIPEEQAGLMIELAREVLTQNIALAREGVISFDDQVYCPTLLGGRFPQFPVMMVDEKQDLSPLNHEMLRLSARPDGRLIAVGDDKQAIYAFRGADGKSSSKIKLLKPKWVGLPLATTFRCPKVVVARQQAHAPGFTAWHTNPDGRFTQLALQPPPGDAEGEPRWTWGELVGLRPSPGASIAILCRSNAPLLSMAFRLIRQGIAPVMLGRDIGKGLAKLAKQIAPGEATPIAQVRGLIEEWETGEASKFEANGDSRKAEGVRDRAGCLYALIDGAQPHDAGGLATAISKLFARERGDITLGSIHRAKGLEWDCVMHLDPWRLPSRYAREAAEAGNPIPLEQEWNLKYVCETRARHTLVQASAEDFK